ncbi:cupin domain-containing protein [Acuticoccus mangrovi]|uniref:Uncharacterized protein n=1 Tax=Acuticoccus mangrovi TaxID=2796142 RepID=A0A934MI04_9HYPH|nr:cupin domain-containing protein [Acuticoccus mangrovi]MBJ3778243.1 hypothetical protein [Acuticoccus mangrovi]
MSGGAAPAALRLTVYDAAPGADGIALAGAAVFVYAASGEVSVVADGTVRTLSADDGAFADPGTRLTGDGAAWIYTVAGPDAPFLTGADIVLSEPLQPAFGAPFLVRADRIESTPGAQTPRHGHRGPGIRRLLKGRLLAEVGEKVERIAAGSAWFETGHDMVVGTNTGDGNAAFVRVMVLPMELRGGLSSFMPADEAEARKPRSVNARLFGETTIAAGG